MRTEAARTAAASRSGNGCTSPAPSLSKREISRQPTCTVQRNFEMRKVALGVCGVSLGMPDFRRDAGRISTEYEDHH
ncbi:hypothetical protein GCM10020216_034650 [Nonomuraea helvata]